MAQTLAIPVAPSLSVICNGHNVITVVSSPTISLPVSNQPQEWRSKRQACGVFSSVIHGIERTRACQILCDLNLENKIMKDLSDEELISVCDSLQVHDGKRFEEIQFVSYKEIEGDSILQRHAPHSGIAVQRATHEEQLQDIEG